MGKIIETPFKKTAYGNLCLVCNHSWQSEGDSQCPVCAKANVVLQPVGRRGKQPTFLAKIGTMAGSVIIVKRCRSFHVDQRVQFAETRDLEGMSVGMAPRWRNGIVWKIEDNRLFINLI